MATKLTDPEMEKRQKLLLRKLDDRNRMVKDHAEAKKAMKDSATALEERIFELRMELKSGERYTPEQSEIPGTETGSEEE